MSKATIFLALCIAVACMIAITSAQEVTPKPECACIVTKEHVPVCGSDGVTYANWRKLHCKNECDGTRIKLDYKGDCKEEGAQ